jgi:tRNA threonylcarbamoyladenosine biosynthesis protein TsaB
LSLSSPILLAIEASQKRGGVSVRDRRGQVHVEWLAPSSRHDDDLMPAIDRLYARLRLEPMATDALGVSIGPGGFTGLRIAVSTVKMLAEVLGAKIIAVPSALVVAESYEGPEPIIVALASKRQTVWATRLKRRRGAWAIVGEAALVDALCLEQIKTVVADDHLPATLRTACGKAGVPVVEPTFDPRACLAVASRLLQQGQATDPLALRPLYPRPPEAVTTWERRHLRPDDVSRPSDPAHSRKRAGD